MSHIDQDVAVIQTGMTVVTADSALVREHREPLSSFDLFIPKEEVVVILCYEKPDLGFNSLVDILKKSLAETLVHYYVFAGELVSDSSDEAVEILCNNRGVEFREACVDLDMNELDLHKPDAVIGEKLCPKLESGRNLTVQVTEFLKCGSVVMACKFDHRVADAYAMNIFLVSWCEKALSKPLTYSPSRMIFKPRCPLRHGPELNQFFAPMSSLPPPVIPNRSRISRMYCITKDQTVALQNAVSTLTSKRTKFESFSAFLWQLLAKSVCQEITDDNLNNKNELITKMMIIVDGRSRLISMYDFKSCETYFGNVISPLYGSETQETIMNKPLTWVGERVAEIIKAGANADHFQDIIDFVEKHRSDSVIPTGIWPRSTDGSKVCMSSGLRFPIEKLDFGWGRPVLGFYYFPVKFDSGYVMPIQHPAGNGDWIVYMYLPKEQIEYIEKEAQHVFRPCSFSWFTSKSTVTTPTLSSNLAQKSSMRTISYYTSHNRNIHMPRQAASTTQTPFRDNLRGWEFTGGLFTTSRYGVACRLLCPWLF